MSKRTPDNQAERTEVPGLVAGRIGMMVNPPARGESTLYGTNRGHATPTPTRSANPPAPAPAPAQQPRPARTIDSWPVSQLGSLAATLAKARPEDLTIRGGERPLTFEDLYQAMSRDTDTDIDDLVIYRESDIKAFMKRHNDLLDSRRS